MSDNEHNSHDETDVTEPSEDIHFAPLVQLQEVEVKTMEEGEETVLKLRAKLFRFDKEGKEWKERGTGDVKLLQNKKSFKIRLLMRREKTLKVCANHYVLPSMQLQPNIGSDRSWVWNVPLDYADNEAKPELLAIRFLNVEQANKFRAEFEAARAQNDSIVKGTFKEENARPALALNPEDENQETTDKKSNPCSKKDEVKVDAECKPVKCEENKQVPVDNVAKKDS